MRTRRTKSGENLIIHTTRAPEELADQDGGLVAAVGDHVEKHFGTVDTVFHEFVSPYVHIDLYVVAPTDARPVTTVVPSGMSQRPMPAEGGDRYAELMLA